jgi:hypothetical protein
MAFDHNALAHFGRGIGKQGLGCSDGAANAFGEVDFSGARGRHSHKSLDGRRDLSPHYGCSAQIKRVLILLTKQKRADGMRQSRRAKLLQY